MPRVLIANRGEIALRILRACRVAGCEVVAAYSRVDARQRHLSLADDTVCIGESSYLDIPALVSAATTRGCDAVHPGYGMLAENAEFARAAQSAGLVFIGPDPATIETMGNKFVARKLAAELGLKTLPGFSIAEESRVHEQAASLGFPLLVKAAFGGGGRGMRLVRSAPALAEALADAGQEATAAFGDGDLYIEKLLVGARHIEVQVMGDGKGGAIHLGTRDCSVQRQHQKLIEEAPAPNLEESGLDRLANQCAAAAAALKYAGAGTFEFLYGGDEFYFIEMNTRLQVEHPVTEMITGIDLVVLQIRLAFGLVDLPSQQAVTSRGHAIECRINAETYNKTRDRFEPSPGLVYDLQFPGGPGVRIDSHLFGGYQVPHQYDSLVAKIVCWGADRDEALARARAALAEFEIGGIETNSNMLAAVLGTPAFAAAELDTGLLARLGVLK